MGNVWIAIEHGSNSLGFYVPTHMGNVLLKFGFDIQSQTEVRVQNLKNPVWLAILNMTLLKINKLLLIYTSNLLLKFGLDIQSQTEVRVRNLKNYNLVTRRPF